MLGFESWILYLALAACAYMAWNIGANDVANAMGTSVGSGAVTLRQALLLAAVFEFAGAFLVGAHVTDTVRKGIVTPSLFEGHADIFVLGMLSALIAASIFLNLATYWGMPVSTTHAIVGSIVGFGLVAGGPDTVNWGRLTEIVLSWFVSPAFGAVLAYFTFVFIRRTILASWNPVHAARRMAPLLVFPVILVLVLSAVYKGLPSLRLSMPFWRATALAAACGLLVSTAFGFYLLGKFKARQRKRKDAFRQVERLFGILQLGTACYVAFAHGANDVANAVGPFAAILSVIKSGTLEMSVAVPAWILALGGAGIVAGLAIWGYKVIATVGKHITTITPSRGFSAEFATATTVLICSKMGLPVSTSHTLVGSVIGVGMAKGVAALNLKVIRNIVNSWILTVPFSAVVTVVVYLILKAIAG